MSEPGIIDTNILIYAHDVSEPSRRAVALNLISDLTAGDGLIVTAQVLNEFYARSTRPNRPPSLPHATAREVVRNIGGAATVLPITLTVTLAAVDAVAAHGLSFWDALIWATARENGVSIIYTEDLPGRPEIEGVRYVDPFAKPT